MADRMALDLLGDVMQWDDARATEEYAWLRMMSAIKYDGYADFRAGAHFVENLVVWLRQFKHGDRAAAYEFLKLRLVYVSPPELRCLIELFFPEVVTPALRRATAEASGVRPYEVWANDESAKLYASKKRRTLFIGMSDGSRIDLLRRANTGRMSPEQVVATLMIDNEKWRDMGKELVKDEGEGAKFERVFLVEDFAGSGTTFIRKNADGEFKGKLKKFEDAIGRLKKEHPEHLPIMDGFHLHVHHYICTDQARLALEERIDEAKRDWKERMFGEVSLSYGMLLPPTLKLSRPGDKAILDIVDQYYDSGLDDRLRKHLDESGTATAKMGYAGCALPVILDHNTPNNSVPLLWAETPGDAGRHAMDPLFFRRDRHG